VSTRVGLFGGTFDPPHHGHVAALRAAWATGLFDRIEVTVAGDPYQKSAGRVVHSALDRLAMAYEAFDSLDGVVVSDREVRRIGPSYTIDTVHELLAEGCDVDLLVGEDLLSSLDSWRGASELAQLVRVGVVPRPGSVPRALEGWRTYVVPMIPVDLSSTRVRDAHQHHEALDDFAPAPVISLFRELDE
jgi:nicotinate-nucleotide adenylyltransferase